MHICEFRIPMPLTLDEYQIGQLYATLKASLNETGGGEGVEIVKNRPYRHGQYTKKLYHLKSKVPAVISALAPKGSLELSEKSWNSYPTGKTKITNPGYMKDAFYIKIKTSVEPNDLGGKKNVFRLNGQDLGKRKVVLVDIANDPIMDEDKRVGEDPRTFKSKEAEPRGPLKRDWITNTPTPMLTVYKLVRCQFKWWGLQGKVESKIIETQKRFFTLFHRRMFCWLDEWVKLDIPKIRKLEAEVQKELLRKRARGKREGVQNV